MFTNAFPRILSISLLCAFFKMFGIIPLIIIFIILSVICWKEWINESNQKIFLGLVTCLISPCLVINDYSFFFMKISIIGNICYLGNIHKPCGWPRGEGGSTNNHVNPQGGGGVSGTDPCGFFIGPNWFKYEAIWN